MLSRSRTLARLSRLLLPVTLAIGLGFLGNRFAKDRAAALQLASRLLSLRAAQVLHYMGSCKYAGASRIHRTGCAMLVWELDEASCQLDQLALRRRMCSGYSA